MEDIPQELREQMTFVFASQIREVVNAAPKKIAKGKEAENGHVRPKRCKADKAAAKGQ